MRISNQVLLVNQMEQTLLDNYCSNDCQSRYIACEQINKDLKSFIDNEVECVDFQLVDGGPRLDLELNNGRISRKLIDVMRPHIEAQTSVDRILSVDELTNFDDIVFELRDADGSPRLLLKKGECVTWTPIASRTRSRMDKRT